MKKGFTLLELIVVVIIIAILASIALPQYIKVAEKARLAEGTHLLGLLRSSQIRYKAENDAYATDMTKLDADYVPNPPNYFTVESPTIATEIAKVKRNTNKRSVGEYTLTITEGGTIACTPTAECAKVGY